MAIKQVLPGKQWAFCDQCGKPIPVYQGGTVPEGYVSPEIWRIDTETVEGIVGMKPVSRVVCNPCYREAFARQYPGVECQLKPEEGELPEWILHLPPTIPLTDIS